MIKPEAIDTVRKNITDLFLNQLKTGKQNAPINDAKACGQFLSFPESKQRGVHGSASALRVLADSKEPGNKIFIEALIKYLENRDSIESAINDPHDRVDKTRVDRDSNNIIKISEVLYALSFVKTGVSSAETFTKKLAKTLEDSRINDDGWAFFVEQKSENKTYILPSAFAILALSLNGYTTTKQIEFLKAKIFDLKAKDEISTPTLFAEIIFALYVLVVKINNYKPEDKKEYESMLTHLWRLPFCSFQDDIEQNMEYWYDTQHSYIRIPWQLYLFAISSKLSPRNFSKVATQYRLEMVIKAAQNKGFRYHNSGLHVSARTNGILFDVVTEIKKNLGHALIYLFFNWVDRFRRFLGSLWVRIPMNILFGLVFLYSVFQWYNSQDKFSNLAPELIGPILFWMYNFGKKK